MNIRKNGQAHAAMRALIDLVPHERTNGHSWGYAAIDRATGDLVIEKGVGSVDWDAVLEELPEAELALAHTRFATKGSINESNAHPFPVRDARGITVAAIAHNGTWREAPIDPTLDRCDSWYIARDLEERYRAAPDRDWADLIMETGEHVGETLTVLVRDPDAEDGGRLFAYAGRYQITHGEEAAWSSGGERIPTGHLFELTAPAGDRLTPGSGPNRRLSKWADDDDYDYDDEPAGEDADADPNDWYSDYEWDGYVPASVRVASERAAQGQGR